jgi:hypothetical protein
LWSCYPHSIWSKISILTTLILTVIVEERIVPYIQISYNYKLYTCFNVFMHFTMFIIVIYVNIVIICTRFREFYWIKLFINQGYRCAVYIYAYEFVLLVYFSSFCFCRQSPLHPWLKKTLEGLHGLFFTLLLLRLWLLSLQLFWYYWFLHSVQSPCFAITLSDNWEVDKYISE